MSESRLKRGLGRGLSSLLGDTSKKIETNKVLIKDLVRHKFQPRKNFNQENLDELTNSIKERGIIQPIVVRKSADQKSKYEINQDQITCPAGSCRVPLIIYIVFYNNQGVICLKKYLLY